MSSGVTLRLLEEVVDMVAFGICVCVCVMCNVSDRRRSFVYVVSRFIELQLTGKRVVSGGVVQNV